MRQHQVVFKFSDNKEKKISLTSEDNVLVAAERAGLYLANDCREGVCGVCAGTCDKGSYQLTQDTALSDQEKASGMILPCTMQVSSDTQINFDYPLSHCQATDNITLNANIISVEEVAEHTAKLVLRNEQLSTALSYQPGQFISIKIPGTDQWRSYSFANLSNSNNQWEFIIRLLPQGVMSDYLRDHAQLGDKLTFKPPQGRFYLREIAKPTLFFAGGTGISAIIVMLKALAEKQLSNDQPLVLYYGVNSPNEFCCQQELSALQDTLPNLTVNRVSVSSNSTYSGATGFVTDLLSQENCFDGDVDCYMCGPPAMLSAVKAWFSDNRLTKIKFYDEKFVASQASAKKSIAAETSVNGHIDPTKPYKKAIVVGGSISGIVSARILSQYFQEVIVLERDHHHHIEEVKASTPQAHHAHHLLQKGQRELNKLFPELLDDLVAAGTQVYDSSKDYRIFQNGHWKHIFKSNIPIMAAPRRVFETVLRRQLNKYSNISYQYGCVVEDVMMDQDSNKVVGIKLKNGQAITADLVIDASGKNTALVKRLAHYGFESPTETNMDLNVYYTTILFDLTKEQVPDWGMKLIYGQRPIHQDLGYAALYGKDKRNLLITLCSYGRHEVIRSYDEFLDRAKNLAHDDIYQFIKGLTPSSEIKTFKYPKMFRRHFEKLTNKPQGFLTIGDAFASADPISGAGMTKAVLEAQLLDKILANQAKDLNNIATKFYKKSAKLFDYIWFVISEQNYRYPWVKGKRPFYTKLMNWYVDQVLDMAHHDPQAFSDYLMVVHLNNHVLSLMKPKMVFKVLKNAIFKKSA